MVTARSNKSNIADIVKLPEPLSLAIAETGHIGLVESYAQRLADACVAEARVLTARVRVEKPRALAQWGAVAGVEVVAVRR